jgi:superfamily II RNA helicase
METCIFSSAINQNNEISPYLSIFDVTQKCENQIPEEDIAYKFPYTLDAFQQEGIYRIYKNENILITAHTGSGKTVLAIYAIAHCLKKNKKVIYTSPTKSLSNQKYAEFIEKFDSVGIMTGDIKMNPDAQCIIMTTEILRNILYKETTKNQTIKENIINSTPIQMSDVGAVILDEVHYINDPDRGKVWEEVIILLPKEITLVMLSATIDKPEIFASWIGNIKEKPISLIPTSHRVVPLKHYFWKSSLYKDDNGKDATQWNMLEILDSNGKFKNYDVLQKNYKTHDINRIMDKLVDFLVEQNYIPALFFKFSRKKCESICKMVRSNLLTFEEVSQVEQTFQYYMKDYKKNYEILEQYQDVYKQLKKGVVYHHSGLIPILKEIIEILYSKGLVKILFATETFAIGVNMPTKTVLYTDLEKYDNKGQRLLRTDEYSQMSGRAGRRGLDKFGSVIILPTMELLSEQKMRNMMTGKSPVLNSKFQLSYQFVLKVIYSEQFDKTIPMKSCKYIESLDLPKVIEETNEGMIASNFLSKTLIMNENDKIAIQLSSQKNELEKKLLTYIGTQEGLPGCGSDGLIEGCMSDVGEDNSRTQLPENILSTLERYNEIQKKLNDTFFVLNKKDRIKFEKECNIIQEDKSINFKINYEIFKVYDGCKKEINSLENQIWNQHNLLNYNIDLIIKVLQHEHYIDSETNKITTKGIIAYGINECNELLFTELLYKKLLDNLTFPEIIAVLSVFINEKDQNSDEKYISDLEVPSSVKNILEELGSIANYYMDLEDEYKLYINLDYKLYLDFVTPAYIWACGGTIHDVYKATNIYDGNFVKSIMRINNICDNLMDICKTISYYDLAEKIECAQSILIRDITSINSLYVK